MKILTYILAFFLIIGLARTAIIPNYQHDLQMIPIINKLQNFEYLITPIKEAMNNISTAANKIDNAESENILGDTLLAIGNGFMVLLNITIAPIRMIVICIDIIAELIGLWQTGVWV